MKKRDWQCYVTTYQCFSCQHEFVDRFTGHASMMADVCPACGGVAVGSWNHAKEDGTLWVEDEKWQSEHAKR